jgi:hypothetical protein
MLASDDPLEQDDALRTLSGAGRYHIAGSVWREIAHAARSPDDRLRGKAKIALRLIEERRSTAA